MTVAVIGVGGATTVAVFGPLVVAMDSHGGSLYAQVRSDSQGRRSKALASLGVTTKQV